VSSIPNIPTKAKKKYVDLNDLKERSPPVIQDSNTSNECLQYEREFSILEFLTQSNCRSTPRYIANFERNSANPWVQAGFLCFVVMAKVPGIRAVELWKIKQPTMAQLDERRQVQQAFETALL
jgi:hypothetical protein